MKYFVNIEIAIQKARGVDTFVGVSEGSESITLSLNNLTSAHDYYSHVPNRCRCIRGPTLCANGKQNVICILDIQETVYVRDRVSHNCDISC